MNLTLFAAVRLCATPTLCLSYRFVYKPLC